MVKVTILVDDLDGAVDNFVLSYGFSALIELNDKKILFDTGTKEKSLLRNLRLMSYSAQDLDAVILSHNHYDHTNGLPILIKDNPNLPVYVNKYWDKDISYKGKKIPSKNKKYIMKRRRMVELNSNLFITDTFYSSDYGGIYEHACYIKGSECLILICGCCHPGLNKFLSNGEQLSISKNNPLTILGGLHGFKFNTQEVKILYPRLKNIILCHCTSKIKTYQKQFKEKCSIGIVGKTYII